MGAERSGALCSCTEPRLGCFAPGGIVPRQVTEGNLGFPLFQGGEARAEGERRLRPQKTPS
jgi:hypothetical protein